MGKGRNPFLPSCFFVCLRGSRLVNVLVTAGNTQVPIDRVRCLTNLFTGRTGAQIALRAHEWGHTVILLTSHPDVVAKLHGGPVLSDRWLVRPYHTFADLRRLMGE